MAEDQEPKAAPEETPEADATSKPEAAPEGKEIVDSHGQEGISKAKYQREKAAWEAKVADLQAKLDGKAGEDDRVAKLEADLKAMEERLADERVAARLAAAGCVNAKAAKAVLEDYDGDVDKLREACPYLFRQERRQSGSTGGSPAGASHEDRVRKARAAAGLPSKK